MGISRRELILAGFGLTACGIEYQAEVEKRNREKLKSTIAGLTDSPIKQGLEGRVVNRYLEKQAPFTLDFGGVDVKVHWVKINIRNDNSGEVKGVAGLRGNEAPKQTFPMAMKNLRVRYPLYSLATEDEIKNTHPSNLLGDKSTIGVPYDFHTGDIIFNGLSPEMVVVTPPTRRLTQESKRYVENVEKFMLVKESLVMLLSDLFLEGTVGKMKANGEPTTIQASRGRQQEDVEIVSSLFNQQYGEETRLVAAIDMGAYFLAFRAFGENSEVVQDFQKAFKFDFRDLKIFEPVFTNSTSILHAAFEYALNNKDSQAKLPPTRGDIKVISS